MRACWIIYAFAALAPFIGPVRCERMYGWQLRPADANTKAAGSFKPLGVYRTTDSNILPAGLATQGSWIDGDEFLGTHETRWFKARASFVVLIAGYPTLAPNRLELEVRRRDGTTQIVRYSGENPGEHWQRWKVTLPEGATEIQLRGIDASSEKFGWLAFSDPFVDLSFVPLQLWPLLQLASTACLALTLVCAPGLLWMRRRPRESWDLALAIIPGPLLVAALGLLVWLLGGWIAPMTLARLLVAAALVAIGLLLCRARNGSPLPPGSRTAVLASALLVGFATAKANLSIGPAGELFGGLVSRSLAVGGHSDSRMSYHGVQLAAQHAGPFSAEADAHFSPWSFANRGPLAGLIATPIVLATGGRAAADAVNQPWEPFDRQGFAAYRIALIVLASLAAWAVFGAVAVITSARWALVALAVALLAPFFVHEMYFTWPKLVAAAFVLAAFVFAWTNRAGRAGLTFAIGYLFHPLVLLTLPFFALGVLLRNPAGARRWRRLIAPALFSLAVLLVVVPWMELGRLAPLRTGSQTVFFDFFRLSDGKLEPTPAPWWRARWSNFANTFLPFHLLTVERTHESINSVYGPSPRPVQWAFLYWNTLPFALGLPAFALLSAALASALRRVPGVVLVAYIAPALLLVFYWGAARTGVMRHCGHVLFVTTIVLGTWSLAVVCGNWRRTAVRALLHPLCFAWRGAEVALMAFGTTLLNARPVWTGPLGWNDAVSLVVAATCLISVVILLARATSTAKPFLFAEPPRPVSFS